MSEIKYGYANVEVTVPPTTPQPLDLVIRLKLTPAGVRPFKEGIKGLCPKVPDAPEVLYSELRGTHVPQDDGFRALIMALRAALA